MSLNNPFYHRGAIRHAADFFNRDPEITQILGLLSNISHASLVSKRPFPGPKPTIVIPIKSTPKQKGEHKTRL